MSAQLIEKVDLRGEGELLKIQQLLEEQLEARFRQDAPEGQLTEEDRQELQALSADFIAQLRQFVVFAEVGEQPSAMSAQATQRTMLTPAAASLALRSPMLQPLSPPPADEEVRQLEAEVTAASLRVAELRASMQAALQEQLAAKLAACRPTADLESPAPAQQMQQQVEAEDVAAADGGAAEVPVAAEQQQGDGAAAQQNEQQQAVGEEGQQAPQPMESDDAEAEAAAFPMSPAAAELQLRLLAAANRMPALRARLEQATDRLQRVVAAVAADISRPPPNTVEKAVAGRTPGRPATAGPKTAAAAEGAENVPGVSPLFKQALESGQISTRRRVARDVQPVPYSQPE